MAGVLVVALGHEDSATPEEWQNKKQSERFRAPEAVVLPAYPKLLIQASKREKDKLSYLRQSYLAGLWVEGVPNRHSWT